MDILVLRILLSMISQKQSSSIRRRSVSQKRLIIKNQKKWNTSTFAVCTVTTSVISEKQSSFFQQGLAVAKEVGDKETEIMACWNLGIACSSLYDFSK